MGRHVEPLTGGLVTDRDPAQLNKGQLSYIRNMVYKQGATSLRVAPGRLAIATAATGTPRGGVYGLRDMQFDNGMHYLVAGVEDMYRYMDINNPGTFSTLISGQATGKNIEAIQFRNRYYLLNGATVQSDDFSSIKVAYLSATSTACPPTYRQCGMAPIKSSPTVNTTAAQFSQTVTGYYEYWTTEVAKYTQDGVETTLESSFSNTSGPAKFYVSNATTVAPRIERPQTANPTAPVTHWRIYRSPKSDSPGLSKFPVGYMIAELSTAVTSHIDGTAVASASAYPTLFGPASLYSFASASSMASDNGVYASATATQAALDALENDFPTPVSQTCYTFALGTIRGSIKGITVELQGYVSGGSGSENVLVAVGPRNAAVDDFYYRSAGADFYLYNAKAAFKTATLTSTSAASPTTVVLGSSTDNWAQNSGTPPLTFTDTDTDTFMVKLYWWPTAGKAIGIDYVKLTIHYGASIDSTVVFPAVVYSYGDTNVQVGRNFPPPSAKTGDMFNDQMVVNDESNKSVIRYSYPGEPEYFPPTYYLDFETKSNDVVQCIRVVNNRLIVGLDNQLWRVNYLPSERDASFDRGKAIDNISGQYGIVNPMCATTITIEGQSETLAFVSNFGLHTTDGYNIVTRSKNLTWNYSGSGGTPIAVLNDTANRCLRIYYHQDGDPDRELCLWASYDRSDIDAEGNFKFSGPVSMANYQAANTYGKLETAWNVIKSDGSSRFYMGYSSATGAGAGLVYNEDPEGLGSIPGYTSNYKYKTRRMYLNGIGGEWMVDDLYGYCGTYTGSPLLTYTLEGTKTNLSVSSPVTTSKTITLSGQELHRTSPKISVEGLTVACTMTYPLSIDYGQESLVIGSKNLGYEDSGL